MAQAPTSGGLMRHGILPLSVAGAVLLTASLFKTGAWQPDSLDDVIQAVAELHHFVRADTASGQIGIRLIISEQPVSYEQTTSLIMERWRDTGAPAMVALYINRPVDTGYFATHPENYALWGKYLIFGDPELVKRLTSYQLRSARRWF
jgi:hypothetical protein